MKKIPTVFQRDPENRAHVLPEVNPGCEWVLAGEGVATIKYDGTCTMFDGERWWARREVKPGNTPPPEWQEVDADEVTGKRVGWEPIEQSSYAKVFTTVDKPVDAAPGETFELVGPKVNGNPHGFPDHRLVRHGADVATDLPGDYDGLRSWLAAVVDGSTEGIVWHHPDGRRAKLKVRDFPVTDA